MPSRCGPIPTNSIFITTSDGAWLDGLNSSGHLSKDAKPIMGTFGAARPSMGFAEFIIGPAERPDPGLNHPTGGAAVDEDGQCLFVEVKPIWTKRDYQAALKEVQRLWDAKAGPPTVTDSMCSRPSSSTMRRSAVRISGRSASPHGGPGIQTSIRKPGSNPSSRRAFSIER
jgi:hypothetical protein